MQDPKDFSGNAVDLAALAIEQGRAYGLPVDPDKTNERLVRYYVAEGVVDRPERIGRDAAYGYRHLLQLLTARRMAQAGVSLAVIAEHNRTALTRALEEGLDKPLPTQAELLVGSFMNRKPGSNPVSNPAGKPAGKPASGAPAGYAPSAPVFKPAPALPDMLDEVRRIGSQVIDSIHRAGRDASAEQTKMAMTSQHVLQDLTGMARELMKAQHESRDQFARLDECVRMLSDLMHRVSRLEHELAMHRHRMEASLGEHQASLQAMLAELTAHLVDLHRVDASPDPQPSK